MTRQTLARLSPPAMFRAGIQDVTPGFHFFCPPKLAQPQLASRQIFLNLRSYTRFPRSPQWVYAVSGACYRPGNTSTTNKVSWRLCSASQYRFGSSIQSLLLAMVVDLYHRFTSVHPIQLSSTHPIATIRRVRFSRFEPRLAPSLHCQACS
jgi:hypothetical protein